MTIRYYEKNGSDIPVSEDRPLPVEQISRAQHFTKKRAPLLSVQEFGFINGFFLKRYEDPLYDPVNGTLEFNTAQVHPAALIPLWSGSNIDQWRRAGRVAIDLMFVISYKDLSWSNDSNGTIVQKIAKVDSAMHLFLIYGVAYESGELYAFPIHAFYNSGSVVAPVNGWVSQIVRETIQLPQPIVSSVNLGMPGSILPHYFMTVEPVSFGQAGDFMITDMTVYSEVY